MFHRRRATSNPPNRGASSVSPAAALAASQAFLKDRAANVALSSAAAAAALRSNPTTPTPVGEIQTKRMVRKNSLSSTGSSAPGRATSPMGAGTLRRQNSSGSMTERTFRAPSPSRGISMGDAHGDIPPVPAVPKNLISQQHRRATSLQPQQQQRVASPDDGVRPGGRGRSLERGLELSIHSPRGARATSMPQAPEAERSDPRRSAVNFSYPISPQGSPRASPVQKRASGGWFSAPLTTDQQPRKDLPSLRPKPAENLQYQLRETAFHTRDNADQVIVKAKKRASLPPQGTYLTSGGMGAKPRGTAVKERDDVMAEKARIVSPPQQLPTPPESEGIPEKHTPEKVPEAVVPQVLPEVSKEIGDAANLDEKEDVEMEDDDDLEEEIVEPETTEERPRSPTDVTTAQQPAVERGHARTASQLENKMEPQTLAVPIEADEPREEPKEHQPMEKLSAVHPARTAHFAPVAIEPNGVRHQPPPRSLSPAKSALKRSSTSPARNASPSAALTHGPSRLSISEASDTMSDDGIRSGRKKNVRVSFEEPAIAASYPSPTNSSNPESPISGVPRGLGTSKWSTSTVPEDDLQDVMKPRPALPSFGSIRGRRRSQDDVLVEEPQKVTETVSSSLSNSVSTIGEHQQHLSPQQSPSPPLEASSDHAIGGILAQDFAKKSQRHDDAPTRDKEGDKVARHDAWDPLPPEVTSVEGSGYFSDSDDNSTEATETEKPIVEEVKRPPTPPVVSKNVSVENTPKVQEVPKVEQVESKATVPVPAIAVQPASPAPDEVEEYFMIPGGFPEEIERPRAVKIEEPKKAVQVPSEPVKMAKQPEPVPSSVAQQLREERKEELSTVEEETSDDGSSIYSDAAEEFTDDDQEFGSIDAVVESKVQPPAPRISTPPRVATLDTIPEAKAVPQAAVPVSRAEEEEGWDRVQAYWNGVSEKQKQREQSAPDQQPKVVQQPKASSIPTASSIGTKTLKQTKKTAAAQPGPAVRQAPVAQQPKPQQKPAQKTAQTIRQPAAEQPRQSKIPAMKQSMRTQPVEAAPPSTQLRQSMRSQPAEPASPTTHMRQSMREQQPLRTTMRGSGMAASRFSDDMVDRREHHSALQKRHGAPQPISTTTPRPRTAPGLSASMHNPANISRIGAPLQSPLLPGEDDSDASESSFKRARKPKSGFGGGDRYSMRRTMRGSAGPAVPASPPARTSTSPSNRFNLRSLSPTGVTMRRSMRTGSMDAKAPTSKSSFIPSLGKDRSKGKSAATSAGRTKPRFISRFADSSDEEDNVRPTFRSRFADSDDEDDVPPLPTYVPTSMPAGLTPVRGIPRKAGDEDAESTDLEGEYSDEEAVSPLPKSKEIGKHSTTASRIPLSPTSSYTKTLSKRGGLLGSKHAPTSSEPTNTIQQPATPEKEKGKRRFFGFGKRRHSSGPGSLAPLQRPSTPPPSQEQSAAAAAGASPASPTSPTARATTTTSSIMGGKLQRRAKPTRIMSDSWPLPPPPKIGDAAEERPQSHDGVPGAQKKEFEASPAGKEVLGRPMLRGRVFSNDTVETNGTNSTVGPYGTDGVGRVRSARTGKKKKFSALRKVLRLDD